MSLVESVELAREKFEVVFKGLKFGFAGDVPVRFWPEARRNKEPESPVAIGSGQYER